MYAPMYKLITVAKYDALIRTCQYFIVYLVFVFIIQLFLLILIQVPLVEQVEPLLVVLFTVI